MCYIERVSGQLPPVRVRVWVRVRVGGAISLGGNCPRTIESFVFRRSNFHSRLDVM